MEHLLSTIAIYMIIKICWKNQDKPLINKTNAASGLILNTGLDSTQMALYILDVGTFIMEIL